MSEEEKKSWWHTLPGILTGVAVLITAISGLITVLYQTRGCTTPPIESCAYIAPIILYPSPRDEVSTPLTITGEVKNIPKTKKLMIEVYHPNTKAIISDDPLILNPDKKWENKIRLVGGKIGDDFLIRIHLDKDVCTGVSIKLKE